MEKVEGPSSLANWTQVIWWLKQVYRIKAEFSMMVEWREQHILFPKSMEKNNQEQKQHFKALLLNQSENTNQEAFVHEKLINGKISGNIQSPVWDHSHPHPHQCWAGLTM